MAAAESGHNEALAVRIRSRPLLGRAHLPRPRLDVLLDEAVEGALGLLCAPAGSGKTEALVGWIDRRRVPTGWLSLVRADNDPAVFWPALASALDVEDDASVRGPDQLSSRLQARSEALRPVVLDDYHVIVEPQVHAGLDDLFVAPGALHVLIGSRHDPPFRLSRLRAAGRLREIRFEQLRFDEAETADLLNSVMALDLDLRDVAHLSRRTEGWAVGLQLAALALQRQPDRHAYVVQFAADDRHVADYVREEVVGSLRPDLRRFVEETAVLERLTAPLCEAVTGITGAQAVLEELERLNLFITPLDHRRRWYRYHQLFAEWLQLRAPPGAAERHRRAADWLAAHAMPGEAVGHYVQAGEFAAAADLVESRRWELVGQGRQHTLRDWIQALPTADAEFRPALTLAEAWIAYHEGRWDAVAALAETVLDRSDEASGARADAIRAEALCLIAGSLVATGRTAEAGAFAGRALEIVPDHDSNIASALWLITGKVALLGGELDQATRAFAAARRLEPDVPIVEVIARSHRAEILRRLGQPAEAARQARAALAAAEGSGLQDHPEAAVAHLVLSQLTTAEEATAHLARGTDLAGRIPYQPRVRLAASAHRRLGRSPPGPARGLLSRRELDVLRLLASSMSQDEIASELYVSINTLKSHTRSIYQKLGVNSRHEAIEQARRDELL